MATTVPFNRPAIVGSEIEYVIKAIADGHSSSGGPFSERCSQLLSSELGARDVLLTTSCTDALELAALLLDLSPGDVVIVPSFTFVSTALAFVRAGAKLRFADIEPTTLGICPESVQELLDERVRAVVPVHYAGVGCKIHQVADAVGPAAEIVEDNAHGLFGTVEGRQLGSFGRFSTLSFHETKNFNCGEGGALVLNRTDDVERAHVLLDKGTNRRAFLQGQVDKYSWVDTGSSFGLSNLLAAYLLGQLQRRTEVLSRRESVWRHYHQALDGLEERGLLTRMQIPSNRTCAWHMYYVMLNTSQERRGLLDHLNDRGLHATFHYVPLHSSPAGLAATDQSNVVCPVTDDVSGRLLRLPFFNTLSLAAQDAVVEAIYSYFGVGSPIQNS